MHSFECRYIKYGLFCNEHESDKVKQLEFQLAQHSELITTLHKIVINQQQAIEKVSLRIATYEIQRRQLLTSTWGRNPYAVPDAPPVYKPAP
jgi:uncharacterized coiled-coil protein SlyX